MQICPHCHRGMLRSKWTGWSLFAALGLLLFCWPLAFLVFLSADYYQCDHCGFRTGRH